MIPWTQSRAMTTAQHRLMVISAKGGVGKSTVTVNLAAALVANGHQAGIFDADIHGPNIPALLGVHRRKKINNAPENMLTIDARPDSSALTNAVKPFERYGIRLTSLALRVGETQAIQPQDGTLGQMMTFMLRQIDWGGVEVLLLDMPPGTGEPLNSLLDTGLLDAAIIVTTREGLAHMDNGRLLNKLRGAGVRVLGIVENMTHVICPNCGEQIELYPQPADAEVYGSRPVLASLPFDPGMIRQPGGGPPLPLRDPDAPLTTTLRALATTILDRLGG